MKNKIIACVNMIVLLAVIFWNYYANTGLIGGNTIGSLSEKYDNLFTPASYAFAIWGFIYLGLFAFSVYLLVKAFKRNQTNDFISKAGIPVILANLANAAWLWFWLNEKTGISVIFMFLILIFLVTAVLKLNMERYDAPLVFMAFVWWPIDIYLGWISVASIANVASHIQAADWPTFLSDRTWTIIMIIVALFVNLFMVYKRNMREFAAVGIWALVAIAVRHWELIPSIAYTAISGALVLLLFSAYHAYQNRETGPFEKLKRKELFL